MEPRVERITISMTPSEKAVLKRLAEHEGRLSLTATVRHIVLEAARNRNLGDIDETGQWSSESKANT